MDHYNNRPPHSYQGKVVYLNSKTIQGKRLFAADGKKQILQNIIFQSCKELNCKIVAWVILSNHYHLLVDFLKFKNLSRLIFLINGRSARQVNKIDTQPGRKVWWNYYEHTIGNDRDYWYHINYIYNNPVHHGIIKSTNELEKYKYSSYNQYVKKYGMKSMMDLWQKYPVRDLKLDQTKV